MSTRLILTAHGSADPRSAANAHAIAGHLRRVAPEYDVRVAFCEHNAPNLRDELGGAANGAAGVGGVVVAPFLLASAYHAGTDIPSLIADSTNSVDSAGSAAPDRGARPVIQTATLGEDDRLLQVLGTRLAAAGVSRFDPEVGVMAVAVGSSDTAANARTALIGERLSRRTRWAGAEVCFATGPTPSLEQAAQQLRDRGATRLVIAPWFLAHGRITDRVAGYARRTGIAMAEPLGAHRLVAATVLDRVEAALSADLAA